MAVAGVRDSTRLLRECTVAAPLRNVLWLLCSGMAEWPNDPSPSPIPPQCALLPFVGRCPHGSVGTTSAHPEHPTRGCVLPLPSEPAKAPRTPPVETAGLTSGEASFGAREATVSCRAVCQWRVCSGKSRLEQ